MVLQVKTFNQSPLIQGTHSGLVWFGSFCHKQPAHNSHEVKQTSNFSSLALRFKRQEFMFELKLVENNEEFSVSSGEKRNVHLVKYCT